MTKGAKPIFINQYRTHTNSELTAADADRNVRLSGWVHARRDHGGLIFIDLRDKWGVTQLTFDPQKHKTAWQVASQLRAEYVIKINGTVRRRPAAMVNQQITTGEIEVEVAKLTILSVAKTPPFAVAQEDNINEELRLTYRFLDLRRPSLQHMLHTRAEFIAHIRRYMQDASFVEVQTPILANSSPEGARDFLVPSRLYPGKFYALPQAPQQFKQLLMVAGLDRYFQIAPCFRDEDSRADRAAGEFYQLDLEMSFATQEDVFAVVEPLMIELTKKFSQKKVITDPFPRLTWHEAMTKYGSDKPDLRYELFIQNVSDIVTKSGFKVFDQALADGGVVHALLAPGGTKLTRKDIDELTEKAKIYGAQGLAYLKVENKNSSPLSKHLQDEVKAKLIKQLSAQIGDLIFFAADEWDTVCHALGAVRTVVAAKLNLADNNDAAWAWVTDFPMYELNEETGKIDFSHNPFSMPQGGLQALATKEPTTILGYQYDLALNGYEISSGAIRNHRPDIMYKAFAIAGYTAEQVDSKFGGMIRAFEYGAPPHGGFAPGVDRLFYLLQDLASIRDIHAFPKDAKAKDLMMNAPSSITDQQLQELHLKLDRSD